MNFVKLFLVQSLPQDLLDTYCYIHGTFTVGEAGPAGGPLPPVGDVEGGSRSAWRASGGT